MPDPSLPSYQSPALQIKEAVAISDPNNPYNSLRPNADGSVNTEGASLVTSTTLTTTTPPGPSANDTVLTVLSNIQESLSELTNLMGQAVGQLLLISNALNDGNLDVDDLDNSQVLETRN
jgi:hypothetical protein